MDRRRRGEVLLSLLAVLALAGTVGTAAVRAAAPEFGQPTIVSTFGQGITLTQPVTVDEVPARVELLLRVADASGPEVIEVPAPTRAGATTLDYQLLESDGHILPNTPIEAQWRVTPRSGEPALGPVAKHVYADDRFDWQTVSGDVVRVHWYKGDRAFGERALRIGEQAVADTSKLLGVTETEPVDFYIYADQGPFYDALGPATRENVGGQAVAGIRTLFAQIAPGGIDDPWVRVVVPHELVHLVFDTAVENPYHFPPRWLNEGLADDLAQGYTTSYRRVVEASARDGSLIPLAGLTGQFPTSGDRFLQAYAESVSAVDYFIRTHGRDALVKLIRSYADGRTDDEAFTDAIGMDVAAFDAAWIADLGAKTPVAYGPKPAPAGPVPSDWRAGASGGAAAPPTGASPAPGGAPAAPTSGGGPGLTIAILVAVALILLATVGIWRARQRGRPAAPGAPEAPPAVPPGPRDVVPSVDQPTVPSGAIAALDDPPVWTPLTPPPASGRDEGSRP